MTTVAKVEQVSSPCNERAASSRTSIPWSATGSSDEDYLREVKLQTERLASVSVGAVLYTSELTCAAGRFGFVASHWSRVACRVVLDDVVICREEIPMSVWFHLLIVSARRPAAPGEWGRPGPVRWVLVGPRSGDHPRYAPDCSLYYREEYAITELWVLPDKQETKYFLPPREAPL